MQGHTVTGDGGTPPDPVEDQASEDQVDEALDDAAAAYARIAELRGRGASVSGAY